MNDQSLLDFMKDDNDALFGEYLHNGGDYNLHIEGKSLLEHGFLMKAENCVYSLLLYGADPDSFNQREDWPDLVKDLDPSYFLIMQELASSDYEPAPMQIQQLLNRSSEHFLGKHPFSFRNLLSFHTHNHAYYSMLACGIHWFEWFAWDYLTEELKTIFKCDNDPAKFATLITIRDLEQMGEEIPRLSMRIKGFLFIQEFPALDLEKFQKLAEDNKELIIGVHYSDEPSLVVKGEEVDIHPKFQMQEPVIHTSSHVFSSMAEWDRLLDGWVKAFKERYQVFPNIMLASSATYGRIDMVANARGKENLHNPEGQNPPEEEFASMQGFKGKGYELDFCIDENLGVDTIRLIFDSDPNGGLPIPEESEEELAKAI